MMKGKSFLRGGARDYARLLWVCHVLVRGGPPPSHHPFFIFKGCRWRRELFLYSFWEKYRGRRIDGPHKCKLIVHPPTDIDACL